MIIPLVYKLNKNEGGQYPCRTLLAILSFKLEDRKLIPGMGKVFSLAQIVHTAVLSSQPSYLTL
jgi:hypothetical protein